MENRGGNVGERDVATDQVWMSVSKYTASGSDGMDVIGLQGQFVQSLDAHAQQYSHLVYEGSRAAGTVPVHAQVDILALKEDYLGILSTDVDQGRGFGVSFLSVPGGGYHLLYKPGLQLFGRAHTYRAGDGDGRSHVAQLLAGFAKVGFEQSVYLSVVPFVTREYYLSVVVENHHLGGRRANV